MIAIINYGSGNIKAFANIYRRLSIPYIIASNREDLCLASKIILPGVGAFDNVMCQLEKSGMRQPLTEMVLERRMPLLGVCVGMQILAHSSDEGKLPGLGWIDGEVRKFDPELMTHNIRLPHMGWNDVKPLTNSSLFSGLEASCQFYFLHSYYFHCNNQEDALAQTDYGGSFASAVNSKNIFGVQFHPEKSHHCGIQLLKNFSTL